MGGDDKGYKASKKTRVSENLGLPLKIESVIVGSSLKNYGTLNITHLNPFSFTKKGHE